MISWKLVLAEVLNIIINRTHLPIVNINHYLITTSQSVIAKAILCFVHSAAVLTNVFYCRPKSVEVLSHCLFWSKEKILAFFQDVSDRVEKELPTSPISQALEQGALHVVKGDWKRNISDELREGM